MASVISKVTLFYTLTDLFRDKGIQQNEFIPKLIYW